MIPFDLHNPPAEPPADCTDARRWRYWRRSYRKHQPNQRGVCPECREPSPCFRRRIALRALVDCCAETTTPEPLPGPPRRVSTSTCRWCGQEIELHSIYGWVHTSKGFIVCAEERPGVPPLTRAEPDPEHRLRPGR